MKYYLVSALVVLFMQQPASGALRKELTDAEIDALEAAWDKDEEEDPDDPRVEAERRYERGNSNPGMTLEELKASVEPGSTGKLASFAHHFKKDKTLMIFIGLNPEFDTRAKVERVMQRWQDMLMNGAIAVKTYMIEELRFLCVIDDGAIGPRMLEFLEQQPEFDYAEIDQQKYFGKNADGIKNPGKFDIEKKVTDVKNEKIKQKRLKREAREKAMKERGEDPFKASLKKKAVKKNNQDRKRKKSKAKSGKDFSEL